MKLAASVLAIALAAFAVPAQSQSPAGSLAITPATQGEITAYLAKVKATRPGAFAVSPDGRTSFYTWCDDTICRISTYSIPALNKVPEPGRHQVHHPLRAQRQAGRV